MGDVKDAFILAAGYGTRLRPITHFYPKALIPIYDYRLLDFIIVNLWRFGVKNFYINAYYKKKDFALWVHQRRKTLFKRLKIKVFINYEDVLLGTGGAFLPFKSKLENKMFLLVNGDIYFKYKVKTVSVLFNLLNMLKMLNFDAILFLEKKQGNVLLKYKIKNFIFDVDFLPRGVKTGVFYSGISIINGTSFFKNSLWGFDLIFDVMKKRKVFGYVFDYNFYYDCGTKDNFYRNKKYFIEDNLFLKYLL